MTTFQEVMEEAPKGFENQTDTAKVFWDYQPSYWEGEDAVTFWSQFEDAFSGVWGSERDFAVELAESIGYVTSDDNSQYFDYEAFENDLFMGDYWAERVAGGVVVFRSY
jgi:antirestriction protein